MALVRPSYVQLRPLLGDLANAMKGGTASPRLCAGGCTDPGESLRDSALRECLEEAGVEVELKGLVEVGHGYA